MLGSVLRVSMHKADRNSQGFLFWGGTGEGGRTTGRKKKINLCKFEKPLAVLPCFFREEIFWEGEGTFTQDSRFVFKYITVSCSKMAATLGGNLQLLLGTSKESQQIPINQHEPLETVAYYTR